MPIASLKILSPNTIAYKFSFASISLKIASTATGSVADMSEPNAHAYYQLNAYDMPSYPHALKNNELKMMAMNVPPNAYAITEPIFLKNGFLCML